MTRGVGKRSDARSGPDSGSPGSRRHDPASPAAPNKTCPDYAGQQQHREEDRPHDRQAAQPPRSPRGSDRAPARRKRLGGVVGRCDGRAAEPRLQRIAELGRGRWAALGGRRKGHASQRVQLGVHLGDRWRPGALFGQQCPGEVAANGSRPASIAYSTAPRPQMSVARVAGAPASCSGAIQRSVPMTVPGAVRPSASGSRACAIPKSTIRGDPAGVISTFAGFTSRWTMPCRCAASRASASVAAIEAADPGASGPRAIRAASDSPCTSSRTRPIRSPSSMHVVDRDDPGMRQRRDRARLREHPRAGCVISNEVPMQQLHRNVAPEALVPGSPDLCGAACADLVDQPVAAAEQRGFHRLIMPGRGGAPANSPRGRISQVSRTQRTRNLCRMGIHRVRAARW